MSIVPKNPIEQIKNEYYSVVKSTKIQGLNEFEKRGYFASALSFHNLQKNRYPDVLPNEKTRVHLKHLDSIEGSDYINANFILNSQYISCQAPVYNTMYDFWRMIWEQESRIIVMLTNLYEGGVFKAQLYWPLELTQPLSFCDIQLMSSRVDDYGSFTLRTIIINRGAQSREIYHFHFTGWPDFGIPDSTDGIRDLCKHVTNISTKIKNTSPIVAHCSAGLGRSGSFIAIHYALKLLSLRQFVDTKEIVSQMRKDRSGMVTTETQYIFIYKAIRDHCLLRNNSKLKSTHGQTRHISSDRLETRQYSSLFGLAY